MKKLCLGALASIVMLAGSVHAEDLMGAGASFPYPLYSKMFYDYNKKKDVQVNYQAIGSGGGVRQIDNKVVDFGASDGFVSDEKLAKIDGDLLHVPICLGAVVVTYNIPGGPTLNMSQDVLADMFLGKIKKWNDERIQALNPDVVLPKLDVVVVHRSDGSGTTSIFTDFLTKISPEWTKRVGHGKSVKWPVGLGGKKNAGVAGLVKQIPGSVGYVELAYALQNKLPQAKVENKAGNFIRPTVLFTSLAGDGDMPDDTRVSITNTDELNGYPIAGFTWVLVYKEQNYNGRSREQAQKLVNLLWWMIHDGQDHAEPLHYVPLSDGARQKAEAVIKLITYNGVTLK